MLKNALLIADKAGRLILDIYQKPSIQVQLKEDQSPFTEADNQAHQYICEALSKTFPAIPILSEESHDKKDYTLRKNWETFFLIDPLDGTKEFIQGNGEFTINIALIHQRQPVLGVIHAPALNVTFYAEKGKGAHKIEDGLHKKLPSVRATASSPLRIVISRSHACEKTQNYIQTCAQEKRVETQALGSALKFGLIAEGKADIYPRFSPTMEWDTAAGQVLISEVGKKLMPLNNADFLEYNKVNIINPGFIVQ